VQDIPSQGLQQEA